MRAGVRLICRYVTWEMAWGHYCDYIWNLRDIVRSILCVLFERRNEIICCDYVRNLRNIVRSTLWAWALLDIQHEVIIVIIYIYTYRVSQEEYARLRKGVLCVKVYWYNPKHLCPKLNGYGDKDARKVWSSCGSTYYTWFAWRNTHTLRIVRPCLQPAQARSSLRLHMYSAW